MKKNLLILLGLILIISAGWYYWNPFNKEAAVPPGMDPAAARSCSQKLARLAADPPPPFQQVEFLENEINSFLYYGLSKAYPNGVKNVRIKLLENSISVKARVNFNELQMEGRGSKNVLIHVFLNGEHDLEINTTISCQNGAGNYRVLGAQLDQGEIPKPLVDLIIAKLVTSKIPGAKSDNSFTLPNHVQRIETKEGKLIVVQGTGG